jgi:hypothetical protein
MSLGETPLDEVMCWSADTGLSSIRSKVDRAVGIILHETQMLSFEI